MIAQAISIEVELLLTLVGTAIAVMTFVYAQNRSRRADIKSFIEEQAEIVGTLKLIAERVAGIKDHVLKLDAVQDRMAARQVQIESRLTRVETKVEALHAKGGRFHERTS